MNFGEIESPAYGLYERDVKAFLREMVVVAEDLCKAIASHRLHRDTIGQAVFFVETVFIQGQSLKKPGTRHLHYTHAWIRQHLIHTCSSLMPQVWPCGTERRKKFQHNRISRK